MLASCPQPSQPVCFLIILLPDLLQVDKVYYCAAIDKYITCARDGSFRLWQGQDLDHVKTVINGTSWITDCLYMPQSRKMVFTTMDRAITYYDIARCVCHTLLCGTAPYFPSGVLSCSPQGTNPCISLVSRAE